MFSFLIFFSSSTYLEYSSFTINEKIKNSVTKPIFFLCYSHYCPHCHGLPEGLKAYSNNLGNRDDIYISMVDCAESNCARFKITGTPTMYLIIGENARYWPRSPERGPEGWDRWINNTLAPSLREVFNETQVEEAMKEPTDGGSVFFYQTNIENDPFLEDLKVLSKHYKIYNDTFIYKYDKKGKRKLEAYTSKYCSYKYKGSFNANVKRPGKNSQLNAFLDTYKFGVLHKYDKDEMVDIEASSKMGAIIVSKGQISESQRESLIKISKDHCDVIYGWHDVQEETKILKNVGATYYDVPFLYGYGMRRGKRLIYKGKISEAWNSGFLYVVKNKASGNLLKSFISKITLEDIMYFSIFVLCVMICVLIYVIADFCKYQKAIEKKRKLAEA